MDYWNECISEALDDAGIAATQKQIDAVVLWVEGAHENYGMAHGHDCIPNPLGEENKRLARELAKEREKIICGECNGRGRITSCGPVYVSSSECHGCHGEGRHAP